MWIHCSKYDENLSNNPFFQEIKRNHSEILDQVIEGGWIICVPKIGKLKSNEITKDVITDHILIPKLEATRGSFTTISSKNITIKERQIFSEGSECGVKVLFEETYYIQNCKYTVWCLDRPLFSEESLVNSSNETIVLNTLHDCIDFLCSECTGYNVFHNLQAVTSNFLKADDGYEYESLQTQKDLLGKVYSQCLQIVLKCDDVNQKTQESRTFLNNLQLALETYMQSCISKRIFQGLSTNLFERESHLNKIIQNSSDLQLDDLSISDDFSEVIICAKCELNKINRFSTALEKLNCLKSTFNSLTNNNENQRILSSDNLLQIFIYLILKLPINNWWSNLFFIKSIRFNSINKGDEEHFLVSTLEASLEYIKVEFLNILSQCSDKSPSLPSGQNSLLNELFECVKLGNLKELVRNMNDGKNKIAVNVTDKLCHPLCSCSKCLLILNESTLISSINLDSRNDKEQTLLHVASLYGHCDIIDYLIAKKADINCKDFLGRTPLHYAALKGIQDVVLLLLNLNCDSNAKDNNGNTALILTSNHGHERCVKALLYSIQDIEINCPNNYGDTALHLATKWGYIKIVQILLENEASPNVTNKRSQTPFELTDNCYILKMLEQFSMIESKNKDNFKYEEFPVQKKNIYLSKDFRKDHGSCPRSMEQLKKIELLLKAIRHNDLPLTCFYLGFCSVNKIEHFEIEEKCHPMCTCDKCFVLARDFEIITIQKHKEYINVNFCNGDGYTPLHVAAIFGRTEILRMLLDLGALPNLKTYEQFYTPLHLACIHQKTQATKELVSSRGCDINIVDSMGNTPLYYACMNNDSYAVEILLSNGADCSNKNKNGRTIVEEVQDKMLFGILKLLQNSSKVNLEKMVERDLLI